MTDDPEYCLRDVVLSHCTTFCFALGASLALIAGPLRGLELQADALAMGWIAGVWGLSYSLVCTIASRWWKFLPPKRLILCGCCGNAVTLMCAGWSPSTRALIVITVVYGATWGLFWPPSMAWLARSVPAKRLPRQLGIFNQCWCGANVLGSALGGVISQHVSPRSVFFVAAAASLLALLFVACRRSIGAETLRPRPNPSAVPAAPAADLGMAGGTSLRWLWVGWLGHALGYLCVGAYRALFPLIAATRAGFTDQDIGLTISAGALVQFLAFSALAHWHGWRYRIWCVLCAHLLLACALAFLGFMTRPVPLVAAAIMLCTGLTMHYKASIFYSATGPVPRSTAMAVHEGIIGLGLFGGGWLAGALAVRFGAVVGLLTFVGLTCAVAGTQFGLTPKREMDSVAHDG